MWASVVARPGCLFVSSVLTGSRWVQCIRKLPSLLVVFHGKESTLSSVLMTNFSSSTKSQMWSTICIHSRFWIARESCKIMIESVCAWRDESLRFSKEKKEAPSHAEIRELHMQRFFLWSHYKLYSHFEPQSRGARERSSTHKAIFTLLSCRVNIHFEMRAFEGLGKNKCGAVRRFPQSLWGQCRGKEVFRKQ